MQIRLVYECFHYAGQLFECDWPIKLHLVAKQSRFAGTELADKFPLEYETRFSHLDGELSNGRHTLGYKSQATLTDIISITRNCFFGDRELHTFHKSETRINASFSVSHFYHRLLFERVDRMVGKTLRFELPIVVE